MRDLARESGLSTDTVARFERGDEVKPITVGALQDAFEAAGVGFLEDGDSCGAGEGIWVRYPGR